MIGAAGMDPSMSVMSKSASQASSVAAGNSMSKNLLSNALDPLFDKITQSIHLPSTIYYFFLLIMFIQLMFLTTWITFSDLWSSNTISKEFIKYLQYISTFSPLLDNADNCYIAVIIYSVLFVLVIGALVIQLMIFRKQRRFYKRSLYPTRVLLELLPLVIILPLANFTGTMFVRLTVLKDSGTINIVLFVVGIVEYIITSAFFFFTSSVIGSSAYFSLSPFTAFNHRIYVNLVTISSVFLLLSNVFEFFPEWTILALVLVHVAFMALIIIQMTRRPFLRLFSNILFLGISFISIGNDLLRFVSSFFEEPNGLIGFICFLVFIVLGFVGSSIFYNVQNNYIKKQFIFETNEDNKNAIPSDDERLERLLYLKLDQSKSKALYYYDYIISNHITSYLDFFIVKFIIQYHHSIDVLCHCIRVMCCLPSNNRNLNVLYSDAIKRRDMDFSQRFLLSQVQKIKILRQSASSTQTGERIKDLKQHTKELQNSMKNFWSMTSTDMGFLISTSNTLKKTKTLWDESLAEFPNSIQYIEESMIFLIECNCDFVEAIKSRNKIDLIESGKNFNVDMCFRQFVRTFPEYLKKNIIDLKGNFIYNQKVQKSSGNQSTNSSSNNGSSKNFSSSSSSSSSMSELEVAVEEGIGKVLLNQSKIRLALQRATETRKANRYFTLLVATIFVFIMGLIISVILFALFRTYFNGRLSISERISLINQARLYLFETTIMIAYHWGEKVGAIQIDDFVNELIEQDLVNGTDPNEVHSFMPDKTYQEIAAEYNVILKEKYHSFLADVAEQSRLGVDMYKYTAPVFEETSVISFTDFGIIYDTSIKYNLKTLISYCSLISTLLMSENDQSKIENFYNDSRDWGTLITTIQNATDNFDEIKNTLSHMSTDEANDSDKILTILSIALPAAYGVIGVLLMIIMGVLLIKEIRKFSSMLMKLPVDVKQDATQQIRKLTGNGNADDGSHYDAHTSSGNKGLIPVMALIIVSLMIAVNAVLVFFQIQNIKTYNKQYMFLNLWQADSRIRKSFVAQLCLWINQAIIISHPLVRNTTFIKINSLRRLIEDDLALLDSATKEMLEDKPGYPSATGVNAFIDDRTLTSNCEINNNTNSLHEMYRCGSLQNILGFFLNIVDQVLVKLDQYSGNVTDEIPSQILHMANNHLIPLLVQIDDTWTDVGNDFKSAYTTNHVLFFILELIIEIVSLILCYFLIKVLNDSYDVVLILLRRVNPISIVASEELINYLLDRSSSQNSTTMSTAQAIIFNSTDSVVFIGTNGIVDILNPSVTKTFGFTPEQLLGQSVLTIFDEESKSKGQIENQLELMRNRQSALTYEDHTICVSDNDAKIPCSITIIGITDEDNQIQSFVIILRDESELIAQQQRAEEAKKTSESLLYQILPRSIVVRLNQGEKDISFTVPSATIMFIDIVKFSDYASSLTPQEIMGNLSLIFAGFDEAITKYELLTKIKLIGDVYMCAGGLFTPEEQPVTHAEQMTKFGLECLQVLEDANVKLNAMLNVRIGINTGGPLIAGVLGTDKPTFDIIGDPINIASRLQSTDVPGRIQISQNTFDLINQLDFSIESRGEVFLKGKGKQQAYLVSSAKPFTVGSSNPNDANNWSEPTPS
ncbi:hypothetical protein M9Y10_025887 [Tritrichomonas musculus]|uniref:Adenylate and Guanylate cyclase catalytic domain containing protein n=1 Tax=Tritrichomonas musculus TaxID=1915356 RepID=A0ABR2H7X5_9EUKA